MKSILLRLSVSWTRVVVRSGLGSGFMALKGLTYTLSPCWARSSFSWAFGIIFFHEFDYIS